VSGFGFNTLQSILPTGIIGTTFQILLSIPSAKLKGYRCIIIACANLAPLVCAVILWQLPRDNQRGLLASYLCFWTYFTPYVLSTSLPMANTSGHTKKVTMNALWFIAYSLGNILGMLFVSRLLCWPELMSLLSRLSSFPIKGRPELRCCIHRTSRVCRRGYRRYLYVRCSLSSGEPQEGSRIQTY
jgi:hypothetical protein